MRLLGGEWIRCSVSVVFAILFAIPANLTAQSAHVVSPSELERRVVEASQARQQEIAKVQQFLSTDLAEKAMKDARVDPRQVQSAVATLSDQELAQLAAKTDKAQRDFSAGNLSAVDLALVILGVVVIILIIVIAK